MSGRRSRSSSDRKVREGVLSTVAALNQTNFFDEDELIRAKKAEKTARKKTRKIADLAKIFENDKAATEKSPGRRSPGKAASPRESPGRGTTARRSPPRGTTARGSPGRGTTARRSPPRGTTARRSPPRGTTARRSPPPEEQSKVDGLMAAWENENLLHLSAALRRKNPKLERERDWGNRQEKIHPGFKDLYSETFIMGIDKDTGNIAHYKLRDYFRNGKSGVRNPDAKAVPENSIGKDENGIKTKYSENGRPTWEALLRVAKAVAKKEKKSQRSPIQVLQAEVGFGNKVDTFESRHPGAVRDIGIRPLFGPTARSNSRSSSSRSRRSVVDELPNFKRDEQSPKKTGWRGVRQTARRALRVPKGSFTQNSAIKWLTSGVARGITKIAGVDSRTGGGYKRNSKNKQRKNSRNKQRKNSRNKQKKN